MSRPDPRETPLRFRRLRRPAPWHAPLLLSLLLASGACGPETPLPSEEILVHVRYVALDPEAGAPVVLLEEREGDRKLPIWIGFSEARSIATQMEHRSEPRPNTHDLAKRVIDGLDAAVERVVVTELRDATFFALLVIRSANGQVEIDARPSDAIAIALRFEAPVYVRSSVFEDSSLPDSDEVERQVRATRPRQPIGS